MLCIDPRDQGLLVKIMSFDMAFRCAVAPNVTVTLQTALLGNYGGSSMQAGFGAVATTANTICFLFNFLTDGVSAKLGSNAGTQDWAMLNRHVRLALTWCAQA